MHTPWEIRWHGPEVDDALGDHVGPTARTGRLCPRCGSNGHGRPWASIDGRDVHVSLSRSGPHTVTVVAGEPVGIDVESIAEVTARWQPELVLSPDENGEPAFVWAAKEAVLKLLGTGLDSPMDRVHLEEWELVEVHAPDGYVAVLARHPAS